MPPTTNRSTFLLIAIAALAVFAMLPAGRVRGSFPGAPAQQEATAYPNPVDTAYPGEATLPPDQGYPVPEQPTSEGTVASDQKPTSPVYASPTLNPLTPSPTAGRNLFGTEDSEMGNSQVTPPPSETPVPSPTPTPSTTPSVTPDALQSFHLNRQLFTLGFVVPLGLLILGWLSYRLLRTGEFKGN